MTIIVSALRTEPPGGVLASAKATGTGVLACVPLASGLLPGKVTRNCVAALPVRSLDSTACALQMVTAPARARKTAWRPGRDVVIDAGRARSLRVWAGTDSGRRLWSAGQKDGGALWRRSGTCQARRGRVTRACRAWPSRATRPAISSRRRCRTRRDRHSAPARPAAPSGCHGAAPFPRRWYTTMYACAAATSSAATTATDLSSASTHSSVDSSRLYAT